MDDKYLEIMPFSKRVGSEILGSSRSTEVRKLGEKFVLKELGKPYSLLRDERETDKEYRSRRVKMCLETLKNEKRLAEETSEFIPDRIKTYSESYLVMNGKDGFPTPFKVQEVVKGKTLREQRGLGLSKVLKKDLDKIVIASIKCFTRTGKVFDLVGCVGGDGESAWEEIGRHLNPIRYAANLMITEDDRLAFIDARVGGGNLVKQLVSLMTLAGYYWKKIGENIVLKSAIQPQKD
ncbi:hypothetical protein KJ953_00505 [Patescibacteria group bacterium]|nr:hypothetical protein [Patescibacteria group bacterium]MBU1256570.1 hypothetical protein [Patescibacteria group bacterium]MBU1457712.1 hypothetical protein [Patescibacteria group bacterium]